MKKNGGITLIALVITIVLMLILASITINVAINGGMFGYAQKAIDDTEIASEKEILKNAAILAVVEDKRGKLSKEDFQKNLNKLAGEGKTTIYDTGEGFEVLFQNSGLYYEVDKKGNVGEHKTAAKDESIANIYLDENGNSLDGTNAPYQINCIEDLVMLSNVSRGVGNYIDENNNVIEVENCNLFKGKYIELTKTLNFNAPTSYANLNLKWSYDAEADAYIIDEESITNLMDIITDKDGVGFVPIGKDTGGSEKFAGNIDGKCHEIQNIYENRTGKAGLFHRTGYVTVRNLGLTGEFIGTERASSFGSQGGTFYNCYSTAQISSPGGAGGLLVEGGNIINCYFNGQVTSDKAVSGLGSSRGNIINCYNSGIINGKGGHAWWPVAGVFDTVYR